MIFHRQAGGYGLACRHPAAALDVSLHDLTAGWAHQPDSVTEDDLAGHGRQIPRDVRALTVLKKDRGKWGVRRD